MASSVARAALSPTLTGLLLLFLTRGRAHYRAGALHSDDPQWLAVAVRVLQVLFGLGMLHVLNRGLNVWATRHWQWSRASEWDFEGKGWTVKEKGEDVTRSGEVVVVTGGCRGIGQDVVRGFLKKGGKGLKVVVVDVLDLPNEFEGRPDVLYYSCDLASPKAIQETASLIRAQAGDPTVLINNAGISKLHTILETDDEFLERIFRVNLLSHFTLLREFLPGMLAQKKGHVVSVASMASYVSTAGLTDYCVTKAGVLALHEGLNSELRNRHAEAGGRHILASVIHPMWVRSPLISSFEASLDSAKATVYTTTDVADKIVRQVLRGEAAQMYVPDHAGVYAGLRSWPTWLQEFLRDGTAKATKPVD